MPTLDYSAQKFPVGTYNNQPQTPTSTTPANGAYLTQLLNSIFDALQTDISFLESGTSIWLIGSGAPAGATGSINDFYIDTSSQDYYAKTGSSTWTLQGNLKGDPGSDGADGADGADGIDGSDGADGQGIDHVNVTSTSGVTKTLTVWGDAAESINLGTFTVDDGADGADGVDGSDGADGQGIDHVNVTSTSGDTKTLTVWGDAGETINLGTFTVEDGATGSVTAAGAVELVHQSSIGAVDSGETWLYSKTDKLLYFKDEDGNESAIAKSPDIPTLPDPLIIPENQDFYA